MTLNKYFELKPQDDKYRDKQFLGTEEDYVQALKDSKTVYVGQLPNNIKEEAIWFMFSTCGEIKRVIMGINRTTLYPCGFCFVEFYTQESARLACLFNKFNYSGKLLNVNIDYGFINGRQFGRGYFGGTFKEDREFKYKNKQR
ncbi:RNA-binding protein [Tubulinosema ratisbonensis]|uniref:Nuclear cap-binding protein subunit 2 n=1 Tax=Tubulinosema ratisbonensis TaxID=291195 RepID=A0A437AH97_9MICR|nr:RNA-binding protein [Tubulinosema ratisbonensis]